MISWPLLMIAVYVCVEFQFLEFGEICGYQFYAVALKGLLELSLNLESWNCRNAPYTRLS